MSQIHKSGEAVKRLDRLAIWHTSADPSGNGYTPNKLPLETQGGHLGVLGGQQFESVGELSDWHQLWFTSADSSGNGHRLNTSRPSIPPAGIGGGGVRVSQIQKSGKAVKRLDRLAPTLAHICRSIWEWIYAKQIAPRDTRGALGVFRGSTIRKCWGAVRLAPTLAHTCRSIWEWIYVKQIGPRDTRGTWGGLVVKQSKNVRKLSNGWTD